MTPRLLAGALAVVLCSGCAIEPPGPPFTSTSFDAKFELTTDKPVVVRTLDFDAVPGATEVASVEGFVTVTAEGGGGPSSTSHDDVWVSILNAETGVASDAEFGNGHASVDGWGHGIRCDGTNAASGSLESYPAPPCHSTWTVVTRWIKPLSGRTIQLELAASMTAHARQPATSAEPLTLEAFSITEAAEPAFAGAPAIASAQAHGSARVTAQSGDVATHFMLRVPAGAMTGGARFPRLGRLFLSTNVAEWTGPPDEARVEVAVQGRTVAPYGGIAGELEWLSLCPPATTCELPIDVTARYWASSGSGKTSSPNGVMAVDWLLEVRLEDFSSGAPALPAVELIALP